MTDVLILGSGTSHGVPIIGCDCPVCRSHHPRNKRTRPSVLIRAPGGAILVDTATDLRAQALQHSLRRIDALLYTHSHADHLHGIDDLRSFSHARQAPIPTYADAHTLNFIRSHYEYIFDDKEYRLGWGIPRLDLRVIEKPTPICGLDVIPIPVLHGDQTILAYRLGKFAYVTDCSAIPERSRPLLRNLHTLILDGLRHKPHPTHFNITQAVEAIEVLRPQRAYLTHLTHDVDHPAVEPTLPPHVHLAYDGLELHVPD